MNECSEAWDEYVPAGMERVLALLPCVCVCVCKRRREGESVHWAEMGPCPSWIFSCSPPTTFYWCLTDVSLRVGKRVGPVKQHSPKAVLAAAKKGDVLSRSSPKMQKKRKKKVCRCRASNNIQMSEMFLISCGTPKSRAALRSHV